MTDAFSRLSSALTGHYRVERQLGQGGMATVYLADDLKHGRKVAIKVLRPELAAALGSERFLREIQTTAGLRHPHILPLYDSGAVDGLLYYVMPYIDGGSLRDRLTAEKQLPIDTALALAREVADALGYAHARGVVHRDIKPENILLEDGHAVVTDFGIARAVSAAGGDRLTETGLAIGTPLYMSPEQAAGDRDVDGRSDLYSLGCVLYEMLAGQVPFTGPTAESITRQHLLTAPQPVTNLRPTVPEAVVGALARSLAKNPADRFSPAAQFVQALVAPAPALGATAPVPAAVKPAGSRLQSVVLGLVAVAVLVAAWSGWVLLGPGAGRRGIERIAVLPMDNQTGDATQGFFADGMTREVIGVLTDAGVRVLGHRAVAAYKGSTLPAAEIAKALGVDTIVTGAVLTAGSEVQVAAELTDPATGENLWARTFTRPAAGVVSLQHEMAAEIARGIRARLTPAQQERLGEARPVDPRAYTQYLLGMEQANLRTPTGFDRSLEYLRRAVELDSTFAAAWGAMAMSSVYALIYQTAPRDSARALLEAAVHRAMTLDDRSGDAYFALAAARVHLDWEFAVADSLFAEGRKRALSAQALGLYGWIRWEMGAFGDIEGSTGQLLEREPTTAQWRSDRAWGYWSQRDTAAARASAEKAVALDSTFYEGHDILSLVLMDEGDFAGADREHAAAVRMAGGDYWVRQFNSVMHTTARGDTAAARAIARELEGDPRLAQRAGIQYMIGNKDGMYTLFQQAIAARDPDVLQIMNAMPVLYPVRKEPRYQALLARIGLPEPLR